MRRHLLEINASFGMQSTQQTLDGFPIQTMFTYRGRHCAAFHTTLSQVTHMNCDHCQALMTTGSMFLDNVGDPHSNYESDGYSSNTDGINNAYQSHAHQDGGDIQNDKTFTTLMKAVELAQKQYSGRKKSFYWLIKYHNFLLNRHSYFRLPR